MCVVVSAGFDCFHSSYCTDWRQWTQTSTWIAPSCSKMGLIWLHELPICHSPSQSGWEALSRMLLSLSLISLFSAAACWLSSHLRPQIWPSWSFCLWYLLPRTHNCKERLSFFFSSLHCDFIGSQLSYNEHVRFLQTNVGLWTPTKTHSRSESIIQYVQSEITDDQKIGTMWCQEAPPSRLAHTFQVKRGPAKKHLEGLPITSSNDNTGDKWRQ